MSAPLYKVEVLKTYAQVEAACRLYIDTSDKHNNFIHGLGIDKSVIFDETIAPKIQVIADQQLSMGAFHRETGELLAAMIVADTTSEFPSGAKSKILKARAALFEKGRKLVLREAELNPKFGEMVEIIFAVTNPKHMNGNFYKVIDLALMKHHISRGYKYRYAEMTVPATQHMFEAWMQMPYMVLKMNFEDFEYEGEKIFANMDFGKGYTTGKAHTFFYLIKYKTFIEGVELYVNKHKNSIRARL